MKTLFSILFSFGVLISSIAKANDKMFLHNGKTLECKIIKVNEFSLEFKYIGEDAEQTIGKYAVAKVEYSSGRVEQMSEKVIVTGKDDWEKVVIVEDIVAIAGMKKAGEITGKTSGVFGYHTAASADKKALRKLKEAAAEMGAAYILITGEKDARASQGVGLGSAQGLKKGVGYTY